MSLEQWRQNNWLMASKPTLTEITQLFEIVERELGDSEVTGLSPEGRFTHAYTAALMLCTIALRTSGYKVGKGEGHHKRTIDALPFSIGDEYRSLADQIELSSRLRGQSIYDRAHVTEKKDADELHATATQLRTVVLEWMRATHPDLVPPGAK